MLCSQKSGEAPAWNRCHGRMVIPVGKGNLSNILTVITTAVQSASISLIPPIYPELRYCTVHMN